MRLLTPVAAAPGDGAVGDGAMGRGGVDRVHRVAFEGVKKAG